MPRIIDRLERPSPEKVYRDYVYKNKPVIIAGIADRWKAISEWTPDYFKASFPDLGVTYASWESETPANEPKAYLKSRRAMRIKLGSYIDLMRAAKNPRDYLLNFPIFKHAPQLEADIENLEPYMGLPKYYPNRLKNLLKEDSRFFLGPASTVSLLHFDGYNNFFVQIYGRKRFLLLSPDQSTFAYYPWDYPYVHYSPVNIEQPDFAKFPLFRKAEFLEAIMDPGEILFIPVRWWHYARSLEESISLNFWWYSASTVVRLRHPLLVHAKGRVLGSLKRRWSKLYNRSSNS